MRKIRTCARAQESLNTRFTYTPLNILYIGASLRAPRDKTLKTFRCMTAVLFLYNGENNEKNSN